MKTQYVRPKFVVSFPSTMEDGVLYISEEYKTAGHKCCCGCGEKVITPLNPAKWRLTKSPKGTVSLCPSIGNWKFACKSHYWIRENRVIAAGMMSKQKIEAVKAKDKRDSQRYINQVNQTMRAQAEHTKWSTPRHGNPTSRHGNLGLVSMIAKTLRDWWKGS